MEMISVQVNLPADLLSLLRISQQDLQQEIQHWVALELFRTRKISAGKAAQIASLSLSEFMDLTRQHDVAWIDYTDDESEAELDEAAALGKATKLNM
jgi:predicted HTH domain antitoxin